MSNEAAKQLQKETRISGQVARLSIDAKGALKVEVSIPLHIAVDYARELLESYAQNCALIL